MKHAILGCLFAAVVTRVVDGDTVMLRVAGPLEVEVTASFRMEGLCAPELREARGPAARAHLEELLRTGTLEVEIRPGRSFERRIGRLYRDGEDMTPRMIADGYGVAAVGAKCP